MGGRVSRNTIQSREPQQILPVPAHRHSTTCITVYGEDGEFMVTGSEDRTICLWDLSAEGRHKRHWHAKGLQGHGLQAQDVTAAASHRRIVSSVQAGAMVRCPQPSFVREGHSHWVTCVHVDGESSLVYSGSMDKCVKVWDMCTARCLRTYHASGDWISGIHVRRDIVWTASEDGCIRLCKAHPHLSPNADDSEALLSEIKAHATSIKKLLAPDGDHLLSGDASGTVCYWHLGLGMNKEACLQATAKTRVGSITCMALPYHEREAEQWNMRRRRLGFTRPVGAAHAPHTQGSTTVSTTLTLSAFLGGHLGAEMWALSPPGSARPSSLLQRFDGHQGAITCLAVLKQQLFTGSEDKTLRAWAVDSGACLQIYQGHLGSVRCLRIVGEGCHAAGGDDGSRGGDDGSRGGGGGGGGGRGVTLWGGALLISGACDLRVWDVESGEVAILSSRRVDAVTLAAPRSSSSSSASSSASSSLATSSASSSSASVRAAAAGASDVLRQQQAQGGCHALLVAALDGAVTSFSHKAFSEAVAARQHATNWNSLSRFAPAFPEMAGALLCKSEGVAVVRVAPPAAANEPPCSRLKDIVIQD